MTITSYLELFIYYCSDFFFNISVFSRFKLKIVIFLHNSPGQTGYPIITIIQEPDILNSAAVSMNHYVRL